MREDRITHLLEEFNVRQYIASARSAGRFAVDHTERRAAAAVYEGIARFRTKGVAISLELAAALELAERTLFSEWFLFNNRNVPRYAAYTNLKVLNWSLGVNRRTPLNHIWPRCRRMIKLLLQDLTSFEVWSLAGFGQWQQANCDQEAVRDRVRLLQELNQQVADCVETLSFHYVEEPPEDWFSLALDESREAALLHLTVLPQTNQHDEVLFLRTIQISECIFWGILTAVDAAIEMLKRSSTEVAAYYLREANWFSKLLLPLFQAFKTMPVEHFRNFREQTGNASAIQSRTYQLMQIVCQGVDDKKVEALSKTSEVTDLLLCAHPFFTSLRNALENAEQNSLLDLEDVKAEVLTLDQNLYTWRCVHLGIARKYLADLMNATNSSVQPNGAWVTSPQIDNAAIPVGTGGTSGPPYLEAHFRNMILKQPTYYAPWAIVEVMPQMVARPLLGPLN